MFGSISPVIKSTMGYNQRKVAILGVAKDLGDNRDICVRFCPCGNFTYWGFAEFCWVWLGLAHCFWDIALFALWVMCVAIFVGTNRETYFNTAALVSCVQNFPITRGPLVGILKGFAALSGAIMTQVYAVLNASSDAVLICHCSNSVIAPMFIVRPVEGHKQVKQSDETSLFIYGVCLVLAVYLLGIMLVEVLLDTSQAIINLFTVLLFMILLIPVVIPILLTLFPESRITAEETLLAETQKQNGRNSEQEGNEVLFSEREKCSRFTSTTKRQKLLDHIKAEMYLATAKGAVRVKQRKGPGPRRGEDFTLLQALVKADFLLIFASLGLTVGSSLAIIDNQGQISQSLGYSDLDIFVSVISVWNFLGMLVEVPSQKLLKYAYPRPVAMTGVQVFMAFGLFYYAMPWPGQIYILTVLVGLRYGAIWAVLPAAVSELFGLKSIGAMYKFLTLASPSCNLIFSGVIASGIYDHYGEKQSSLKQNIGGNFLQLLFSTKAESLSCSGSICYPITCEILAAFCLVAVVLSMIVVRRQRAS
ncbi:LOW QUALITY PROTEIN: Nodulin-like [Dillenia turbinata]|uniref:Nodulin-like n=1 Tax=Dillenia turbinata TaxID=194707 RepID=A0AAN8Z4N6_9MAGN